MPRNFTAFPYLGGKNMQLRHLLPQLETPHDTYVEPFCGSGTVVLNKPPAKFSVACDANGDVINFFKVLRDHEEELLRVLQLTPYHEGEHRLAIEARDNPPEDPVERARLFLVRFVFGRSTRIEGFSRSGIVRNTGRAMDNARAWRNRTEHILPLVAERARQIEWREGSYELSLKLDTPDTLFYFDPPYLGSTRSGGYYEIDAPGDDFHREFLERVLELKGKVAISGYASDLYEEYLGGWPRAEWEAMADHGSSGKSKGNKRTEVLWRNYDPACGSAQPASLFDAA